MISHSRLSEILQEEIAKFHAIGMEFAHTPYVDKSFPKAKSFYADAWPAWGKIRVSYYYLNAPEVEIRATLAHELCHLVKGVKHGHGPSWQAVATKFCRAYPAYNIKRCGSNVAGSSSDYSLRRAASEPAEPNYKHIVKCTFCDAEFKYTRMSKYVLHPEIGVCPYCKHKQLTVLM